MSSSSMSSLTKKPSSSSTMMTVKDVLKMVFIRGGALGAMVRLVTTVYLVFLYIRRRWRQYIDRTYTAIPLPAMEDYSDKIKHSSLYYFMGAVALLPGEQIEIYEKMGKPEYFKARFFFMPQIFTANKADMNIASTKNKSPMYQVYRRFLGHHSILFQEGEKARKERTMLNRGFGQQTYKSMHSVMMASSVRLRNRMLQSTAKQGQFDMEHLVSRATLEIISEGGFSLDAAADENLVYLDALKKMLRIPGNPICVFPYGSDLVEWWNRDSVNRVKELLTKAISKRFEEDLLNPDREKTRDLLDLVIAASKENPEGKIDYDWIRDQVQLLLIGGSDTSSVTLLWGFILLTAYPDVQRKIKQEIKTVFAQTNNDFDRMNKLVYTEAFIKEVLRLYAPFSTPIRKFDEDEHEWHGIPIFDTKWTIVGYNSHLSHRRECYFPQPNDFIPERWLDGRADAEAFGSFSHGFRQCLGKNFAMIEMKTILGVVLEKHTVQVVHPDQLKELPLWGLVGQVASPVTDYPLKLVADNQVAA